MNGCIKPTDDDGYSSDLVWRKDGSVHERVKEADCGVSLRSRGVAMRVWLLYSPDRQRQTQPVPKSARDGVRFMKSFDWHSDKITLETAITTSYKNTQNVRRFFRSECGDGFKFDRSFMAWLKTASGMTMADAVEEWNRRKTIT
jgi:hypothetical protein